MKKKILVVLGGGGHTAQVIRLLEMLGNNYYYSYVVNNNDFISQNKIQFHGHLYKVRITKKFKGTFLNSFVSTIKSFIESFDIIKKAKCDVILSAGPGISVPLFFISKLFRMKTIFLETWSRVNSKSTSGQICYYLSDLFFVQWPDMKKLYPKAIYAGRVA